MRVLNTWILILVLCCAADKAGAQDTLFWKKGIALQWTDFRGEPNFSILFRILSSTGLKYGYRKSKQVIKYEVSAFFLPLRSWKKYISDSSLLQHEQLHFDITELYARKLLHALRKLDPNDKDLHSKIESLASAFIVEKNALQKSYDNATRYGSLKRVQRYWEVLIKKKLEETE